MRFNVVNSMQFSFNFKCLYPKYLVRLRAFIHVSKVVSTTLVVKENPSPAAHHWSDHLRSLLLQDLSILHVRLANATGFICVLLGMFLHKHRTT